MLPTPRSRRSLNRAGGPADTGDSHEVPASSLRRIKGKSEELTLFASDLSDSLERMASSTSTSAEAVTVAADATDRVTQGATVVAAAAEEMSSAMTEVAHSASDASGVTMEAAEVTREVRGSIERLVASTGQIDGVVKAVSGISDQTRLLALNATIEAARAGAAGKGFAVVAEEVKNLAAQTSQATTEIAQKLTELANDSDAVRRAAERIDEVLARIEALQQSIAAAVEQQSAPINEITRSASETADAAADLQASVASSAQAARVVDAAVGRSRSQVQRLELAIATQRSDIDATAEGIDSHPLRLGIVAHAAWKVRLRKAIATGHLEPGMDLRTVARDDACAFGKWLHGGDSERLDRRRHDATLGLHAQFHRHAAQILTAATTGRRSEAEQLLADDNAYCGVAAALTDQLLDWADVIEAADRAATARR